MIFDLDPAAANNPEIVAMAATMAAALEDRIKPVSVILKPGSEMPRRADGGPSFGYWKSRKREIWLWDETDDYPVAKTFAHEAMHVLDTDWLTRAQRRRLMELMSPAPTAWGDQKIDGVVRRYVGLPSEVFAVYASAAIAGLDKPAYRSLFARRVEAAKWQMLRELTLQHHGPPEPEDGADGEGEDTAPNPPDFPPEHEKQLRDAQQKAADALAAQKAAEQALAVAIAKLAKAKDKAAEISSL